MEDAFDILIVGAGTGGATTAITAAKSGLNVCIIDSKQKEDIGDKVCGDIIWKDYFDTLNKMIGIDHPRGDELNQTVSGLKVVSPNKKTSIQLGQEHYMINRHLFGQRLIEKAVCEGAVLLDDLYVIKPLIKDNSVVGVIAKHQLTNKMIEIYGKITVDASGSMPALREKVVLDGSFLETTISKEDTAIAYREVRELKHHVPDSDFAKIYVSNKNYNGGYTWFFPDGHRRVNIGVGETMSNVNPKMKSMFVDGIKKNPLFKDSVVIMSGGGILPTRKPLCSLVANGFMCVGDAGCQVNPISGAGIELSMDGGHIAANVAIDAIENNDTTQEMLWKYNNDYMNAHGAAQTSIDIIRILFQSCTDSDLNFGLKNLVNDRSIMMMNSGEKVNITPAEKAKILLKGIGKVGLLNKFVHVIENMHEAKELCENYPQPSEFNEWKSKLDSIYTDTRNIVK